MSGGAFAVEAFLEMMSAERGAARNTLDSYRRDLADFTRFLERRGIAAMAAGAGDIRAYLADLAARGMAPATVARRLSAVRQFHAFLFGEGHRTDDPATGVEGPRPQGRLPQVLGEDEVERIIEAAREAARSSGAGQRGVRALRFYALVELLYATGLRVSELVA